MDWPTYFISLCSAVVVAFLTPRFQHLVWKRQRLREQPIAIAERFAKVSSNFIVVTDITPPHGASDSAGLLENASGFLEQDALLVLIQILFESRRALDSGNKLKKALTSLRSHPPPEEGIRRLYALRVDLLSCLFAEAFDISVEKLADRAGPES